METQVHNSLDNNSAAAISPVSCDICAITHIHQNDIKYHNNSRGHRKKIREQLRENAKNEEGIYECCKRTFKNKELYDAHIGSKTHKRNLRRQQNAFKEPAEVPKVQAIRSSRKLRRLSTRFHLNETLQTNFVREKFKTGFMKIENLNYKTYIYCLTAYLSLRLALDQSIENFSISVNDKEWRDFGHVVIKIFYKEKSVLYAIQCKKVTQSFRQIDNLEEAKIHIAKQYKYIAQLENCGRNVDDTRFVIFTTCGTSSNFSNSVTLKPPVLNIWKTSDEDILEEATLKIRSIAKKNNVINVSDDTENIYTFILSNNSNCRLPRLFLYTNQRIYPSMLNQLLKQRFDKYPDIWANYTKYIENWIDGKLGGNYKLKKNDIVLKIGEILLNPYVVSPKKINLNHDSFTVWQQIINNVDLTVVKNEPFTISKMCQPLNKVIEETLFTSIDPLTKSINMKIEELQMMKEPIKSYFFEVVMGNFNEVPLHLVYNIFWKAGQIPLLLSSEGQEEFKGFIFEVILFMKKMGVHKKFLIKTCDFNINRFKESKDLKIFSSLEDVKNLVDWNEIKIRVSDSYQLSLQAVQNSDPFFFKWVTPNMFFDISVGKYCLKPSYSSKKIHNEKDVLKIILSDDVKNEIEYHLYPESDISETDSRNIREIRLRGIDPGIL